MTTPVIDLTTSQFGSPLSSSSTTTSTVMTTTIIPPPPPQPQQSTTDPTLMKRIDKLKQHMANLLQYNLPPEERLDKHGSRVYKSESLNIPHQVSKAVDEIGTDAVDWAMQASLIARFSDLPAVDMKKILQQRMFKDKSYEAHKDHKKLYDALEILNLKGFEIFKILNLKGFEIFKILNLKGFEIFKILNLKGFE
nr:hypothetical protein [Tanacetum cinerariifolium]